jgi:cytochrome c-type biogenesis protein CcmH/NrfF
VTTWLLWAGPFLLLLVAAVALRRTLSSRSGQLAEVPALTAEDAALAQRLLRKEAQ